LYLLQHVTALGYQELFHRVVPVELSSFSSASHLGSLLGPSQLPLELKDFDSNFYYREVLPAAASNNGSSGTSSPRFSKAALSAAGGSCRSAGIEMMKVRVLSHSMSGVTTSVRLEMTCDSCLFFHYAANITAASFQDIKVGDEPAALCYQGSTGPPSMAAGNTYQT
jgi:hypothetical protein